MDWVSRYVLARRLSNTLDPRLCVEALDGPLARFGTPEIFNTDQGSQFTSFAFIGCLQAAGIRFSMDGRGRIMYNIIIDRLWRSLKCEAIHLHEIADGLTARRPIRDWVAFFAMSRGHTQRWTGALRPSLPGRDACGYDGQAGPRHAHIPIGAAAKGRTHEGRSCGLRNNRNTP